MSGSNCYFLTCIQISQEASKMVWYSCFLKNFPQFFVIHTVKGFGIVNKVEEDIFLEISAITSRQIDAETMEKVTDFFSWAPKSLQIVTVAIKLKDIFSLEEKL